MREYVSPTIYSISRLAKVSTATVSRAMNAHTRAKVAPRTYRRVMGCARRYGYTPNVAARVLGGAAVKTLGAVFSHFPGLFAAHYHIQLLAGIADALLDSDYHFKLVLLKSAPERWDRYDFKNGEGVDGLIVTHWRTFFSEASVLSRLRIPCVVINDPEPNLPAHCVSADHVNGGALAAQHLLSRGHRRLAVLTGPRDSVDSQLRLRGFRQFLKRQDHSVELTIQGAEFSQTRARAVVRTMLRARRDMTGLFCCNDDMALGALEALHDLGLSCPKDVSIIGYDGDVRTEASDPPLTTIHMPLYAMAQEAVARLLRHLQTQTENHVLYGQTVHPVELIERRSVQPIRHTA